MRLKLAIGASLLVLSGCATRTEYICNQISVPMQPILPTLSVEQDLAIPQDSYIVLATRERLLRNHIELLEELIKRNNECQTRP